MRGREDRLSRQIEPGPPLRDSAGYRRRNRSRTMTKAFVGL
jgi:hypothetical protein